MILDKNIIRCRWYEAEKPELEAENYCITVYVADIKQKLIRCHEVNSVEQTPELLAKSHLQVTCRSCSQSYSKSLKLVRYQSYSKSLKLVRYQSYSKSLKLVTYQSYTKSLKLVRYQSYSKTLKLVRYQS